VSEPFLAEVLPRQIDLETAWHHGDLAARLAIWSTRDPVTLFGAGFPCARGPDAVGQAFRRAVSGIVPCRTFAFDLVAAGRSGDLAYTVGYEHTTFDPGPIQPYTVRVTYLYRREHGEWKIVHRHASKGGDDIAVTRR
jgi:ketosteroid isomerase-like protein